MGTMVHSCSRALSAIVGIFRRIAVQFSKYKSVSMLLSKTAAVRVKTAHRLGMPVEEFDAHRRAFLKYAVFGGTLFLVGKYIGPLINTLKGDTVVDEKVFRNFTITETGKQLSITDDGGDEVLTIDKESF